MSDQRLLDAACWPPQVRDLSEPPAALHLLGELPRGPCVAIVGTRHPTPAAEQYCRQIAGVLARAGAAVLSGGAKGIDTAAHRGALEAGGTTVVVAPSGWSRPYPEQNADLYREIFAAGGAYLSLVASDVPATSSSFFARNAVMVALSHAVVIVEAGFRSGARNAAKWARRLGRPLWVVPHPPWHAQGLGCLGELRLGAAPFTGPRDVLASLERARQHLLPLARPPAPAPARVSPEPPPFPLGSAAERVLAAFDAGARHPDEIAERTGLAVPQIQEALLTLMLEGVLVPAPSGPGLVRKLSE